MNMSNEIRELSINELDPVSGGSDRIGGAAGPVSQPTGPVGPRDPQPSPTPKSASFDPVTIHF
jgi:hypothetical protein